MDEKQDHGRLWTWIESKAAREDGIHTLRVQSSHPDVLLDLTTARTELTVALNFRSTPASPRSSSSLRTTLVTSSTYTGIELSLPSPNRKQFSVQTQTFAPSTPPSIRNHKTRPIAKPALVSRQKCAIFFHGILVHRMSEHNLFVLQDLESKASGMMPDL